MMSTLCNLSHPYNHPNRNQLKKIASLLFSILFLCFSGEPVIGQTTGTVRGRVIDANTKEALPYVNIAVKHGLDSNISISVQTDQKGVFVINKLSITSYDLRVSYLGYQTQTIKGIVLSSDNAELDLADITLSTDNRMLAEVVIEYKRPVVEMLDDKLVYNVDQSVFSEGSVASDILKNVPMVSVDIDGKATIAGRRNTRVFIDGKPSDFSASSIGELLSVLPSDALESIEVITDPSSKFDADGDGIINIVMKKGRKVGLSGNLSTSAGTVGNHNAGAFLTSGKKEKFSFNASAGYNHGLRQSEASSSRRNILTDSVFYNNQSNSSRRVTDGMNGRFSGTYKPDSLQILKFSVRGGFNSGRTSSWSRNLYLNEDFLEKRLRTQNNSTGNSNYDMVLDAEYDITGKHKDRYSFGINYNRNLQDDSRDYLRHIVNPDGSLAEREPDMQLNSNESAGENFQLSADIDKSFEFLKFRIETGTKFNSNNSNNHQLVSLFNSRTQDFEVDPGLTNTFNFHQDIYAGYLTMRLSVNNWNFRLGSRAELTSVSFKQANETGFDFEPYINLFPSLAVNRTFHGKYRIGLNYNRRVNRPRYNVLNPIVDDSDPQNLKFGNIKLKPSFTDQYELSFTMFGEGWSVSPRISYAESSKIIERIKTVVNSNGDTETTYENLASSKSLNFNTYANYRLDKTKSVNGGMTVSQIEYHSSTTSNSRKNGVAIRANLGMSYSFNKSTAMELNLNYIKSAAAQGSVNGSVQTQFGLKRNFLKNKMSARITIIDPFNERNINSVTEGLNFYQESFSVQRTRNFMAGLSYRFTRISGNSE